jgi:hypothetical protein
MMGTTLLEEIYKKFLELMRDDKEIDYDLAERIYTSLAMTDGNKEEIISILKSSVNENENTKN